MSAETVRTSLLGNPTPLIIDIPPETTVTLNGVSKTLTISLKPKAPMAQFKFKVTFLGTVLAMFLVAIIVSGNINISIIQCNW